MSIGRKLWVGFGSLLFLLLGAGLLVMDSLQSIGKDIFTMTRVSWPASLASSRMKTAFEAKAGSILSYLDHPDKKHWDRVEETEVQFVGAEAEYQLSAIALDAAERDRFIKLRGENQELGQWLVSSRDQTDRLLRTTVARADSIETLLGATLAVAGDSSAEGAAEKIECVDRMRIGVAQLNAAVLIFLRSHNPQDRARAFDAARVLRQDVDRFKQLPLNEAEREAGKLFQESLEVFEGQVRELVELRAQIRQHRNRYESVGSEINELLSNQLQRAQAGESAAEHAVERNVQRVWRTIVALFGACLVVGSLAAWRISRSIVRPVSALVAGTEKVGAGDLGYRLEILTRDEIGGLARAFNRMVEKLEDAEEALKVAQKRHLESSRLAGMAEVATGILHNVGNVLNSVNVSCNLVCDQVRRSSTGRLAKVADLLQQQEGQLVEFMTKDARGLQLPQFIAKLSEALEAERDQVLGELGVLHKNVAHIKEIVGMQQSFASVAGAEELLEVSDLLEDALGMSSAAMARHGVQVVRHFEKVPPVYLDKHRILQILVNLLSNAKDAMGNNLPSEKVLTLRIGLASEGRVQISVEDNGAGIAPENLTRIFAHGFTTKQDGHGFGLHSSALMAQEMGGMLTAQSKGIDCGALFLLELPLAEASEPKACILST